MIIETERMWPQAKEGGQPPAARRDKKLVLLKPQKEFSLMMAFQNPRTIKKKPLVLSFWDFFFTTFKLTLIKVPFVLHLSDQD